MANQDRIVEAENPVMRIGSTLTRLSMKYMPDPSIFAVVLTLISFLLGVLVADVGTFEWKYSASNKELIQGSEL